MAWIGYELYGRTALEWLANYSMHVRIAGGLSVIGYLYWQMSTKPAEFSETLDLAKNLLTHQTPSGFTTKEKRNVSGLMKKKIAASQEWKCGACNGLLDETYEVDHTIALYKGGTNDESNLRALCVRDHKKKSMEERLAD